MPLGRAEADDWRPWSSASSSAVLPGPLLFSDSGASWQRSRSPCPLVIVEREHQVSLMNARVYVRCACVCVCWSGRENERTVVLALGDDAPLLVRDPELQREGPFVLVA